MKKNVVAFMNMKGGVGKTTLCVNLADCLARHFDKKVLVIDLDPQFNATQYLLEEQEYLDNLYKKEKTIYSIFKSQVPIANVLTGIDEEVKGMVTNIEYRVKENFYLIAGDLKMLYLEGGTGGLDQRPHMLKMYIDNNNLKEKYDFIFVDCPPTQSVYTSAALNASDYYIMPVKPDYLSTLGVDLFKRTVESFNSYSPKKINSLGIVFTMVHHYNHPEEKIKEVTGRYPFGTFENHLKYSIKVPETAEEHKMIYDMEDAKQIELKIGIINLTQEFLDKFN